MKRKMLCGYVSLLTLGALLSMGTPRAARALGLSNNEILWRNTVDATLNDYVMTGTVFDSYGTISATIPNTWLVVAQADLNGDYIPDVIWQNPATGDVTYWLMDGTPSFTGTWGLIAQGAPAGWNVVAAADMDGDGSPDLIWQNETSGDVTYYQVVNGQWTGAWAYLSQGIPPEWKVIGAADLFGDGNNDLVWWNSATGDVTYIRMNRTDQTGQWGYIAHTIATTAANWRAVGIADFTGDGFPDLVWQNTQTGDVTYYQVTFNAAAAGPQWNGGWGFLSRNVPPVWAVTGLTSATPRLAGSVWPRFHHDNMGSGRGGVDGASSEVKWAQPSGNQIYSSPAIGADGTVYIGSFDDYVYALNGATGAIIWKYKTGAAIIASPAVGSNGVVYAASMDDSVYALNGATGALIWQRATGGVIESSPAIGIDGTVYIGSFDDYVYALNGATGAVIWRYKTGGTVGSSPAIGSDGTVFIGSWDKNVYALNGATGAVIWQYATGGGVNSSPAIGSDGTIYIGSYDYAVYALNGATGAFKWSYRTGAFVHSSPALGSDGTVYVGSEDHRVYALNGATGAPIWQYTTGDQITSSPAVGSDGTVYIGSEDHLVYALNGATGAFLWQYITGAGVSSSPAIGSDGTLYIGSEDGSIYAFEPGGITVVIQ